MQDDNTLVERSAVVAIRCCLEQHQMQNINRKVIYVESVEERETCTFSLSVCANSLCGLTDEDGQIITEDATTQQAEALVNHQRDGPPTNEGKSTEQHKLKSSSSSGRKFNYNGTGKPLKSQPVGSSSSRSGSSRINEW